MQRAEGRLAGHERLQKNHLMYMGTVVRPLSQARTRDRSGIKEAEVRRVAGSRHRPEGAWLAVERLTCSASELLQAEHESARFSP